MKGHIRERSPGHWAIVLDVRDGETGKRKRRWHSFKGGKREAQIECSRLIAALSGGSYLEPNKITMVLFFERWLAHVHSQISPKSHERYSEIIRKNIIPDLGAVLLTKLRPAQISQAYAKALAGGRRDGKGGLAPTAHQTGAGAGCALGIAIQEPGGRRRSPEGRARQHDYV